GYVERHAHQVADLEELDVRPLFRDLAGDLVAERETLRRGGPAADHVLVAAADVGGYGPEDHAVPDLAADVGRIHPGTVVQFEIRVRQVVHLDLARAHVPNASVVVGHRGPCLSSVTSRSGSVIPHSS